MNNLLEELSQIYADAKQKFSGVKTEIELDLIKKNYLGKSGSLTSILKKLATLTIEERKIIGAKANEFQQKIEERFQDVKNQLKNSEIKSKLNNEFYDVLRPVKDFPQGSLHPITQVQYEIEDIFTTLGFSILDGPEIETDFNNFSALNFTDDHPARDMQDTFYLENNLLLRTHTSAVQVRALREMEPPFRIIAPGRVFRYEEVDASHENTFYQIEGMVVGENISISNLIYIMNNLLKEIFGVEVETRLRPGYFPFVEPGFELDIRCLVCSGSGCSVCKRSGWLELLPCGLVHPNVFKLANVDPKKWSGFAFGLGLDRLVMMRYGIDDIRHFHSGNLRFLYQF